MAASQHFKELLLSFQEYKVEYLIVGGYAAMKYSEPHYTKDLDIWVATSPENSVKIFQALGRFGAPLQHDGIGPETFAKEGVVYQIGVAPIRIDILAQISGIQFADAWKNRVADQVFGIPVNFISLDDLIANKRAAGRTSDLEHLETLQKERRNKCSDAQ